MSGVRVLVGTRKGAFILTSDGRREDWDVSGPHFGGWEIYHVKGSPADPDRLYASQSTGWFGQLIQRSDDGGRTWNPAHLKTALGPYTWRLWRYRWIPDRAGRFGIAVRAFDGSGRLQSRALRAPYPSGATGYDQTVVTRS
jgi:hypothetical protein